MDIITENLWGVEGLNLVATEDETEPNIVYGDYYTLYHVVVGIMWSRYERFLEEMNANDSDYDSDSDSDSDSKETERYIDEYLEEFIQFCKTTEEQLKELIIFLHNAREKRNEQHTDDQVEEDQSESEDDLQDAVEGLPEDVEPEVETEVETPDEVQTEVE